LSGHPGDEHEGQYLGNEVSAHVGVGEASQ
jgi:hypothetical protein